MQKRLIQILFAELRKSRFPSARGCKRLERNNMGSLHSIAIQNVRHKPTHALLERVSMNSRVNKNRSPIVERGNPGHEQDRINQQLFSRVREMHNILVQINRSLVKSRTDFAGFKGGAKSAFMKLKKYHDSDVSDVKRELAEINAQLVELRRHLANTNGSKFSPSANPPALIYAAVVFSFLSLALSVWALSGGV